VKEPKAGTNINRSLSFREWYYEMSGDMVVFYLQIFIKYAVTVFIEGAEVVHEKNIDLTQ
jgi:hypothetical protein